MHNKTRMTDESVTTEDVSLMILSWCSFIPFPRWMSWLRSIPSTWRGTGESASRACRRRTWPTWRTRCIKSQSDEASEVDEHGCVCVWSIVQGLTHLIRDPNHVLFAIHIGLCDWLTVSLAVVLLFRLKLCFSLVLPYDLRDEMVGFGVASPARVIMLSNEIYIHIVVCMCLPDSLCIQPSINQSITTRGHCERTSYISNYSIISKASAWG